MSQQGLLRRKPLAWRPGRPSLTVRLTAVAVGLLAAGAAIIIMAGGLATRDQLMRQAGQQLRGYAGQLTRRPFLLTPLSRAAPGAPGLGGLAAAGAGGPTIEVRGAGGQLVMRVGPGYPAGPGRHLAVTEPVRYQAHRIPYAYSAEDFALDVTSPAGPGSAGTLVVSLSVARIAQATSRLTVIMLAVAGLAVLAAGCVAAWMIRAMLGPLTGLARRADAVAGGPQQAGGPPGRPRAGPARVAPELSAMLARLEQDGPVTGPVTGPGPAARLAAGRQRKAVADTGLRLRPPLSVLGGLAEYWRHRDQPTAADFGRLMARVAEETTRIGTLIDALERAGQDRPGPPGPGQNVGGGG